MEKHATWLATGLRVEADTPQAAMERAQEWLCTALERCPLPEGFTLTQPASRLTDIAVLAFQLLGLEEAGGVAAARVAKLRDEVEAEMRQAEADTEEGFEFPLKL